VTVGKKKKGNKEKKRALDINFEWNHR
jgi:hypothetical protein